MQQANATPVRGGHHPVTLSQRALSRATLARQLLLERTARSVAETVEHLAGLQAQTTHSWYVGLWSRIDGLRPETVAESINNRELVRIALMRSTIHLVTARDCIGLRTLMQPVLERSLTGNFGRYLADLDLDPVLAEGRRIVEAQPRTFSELGRLLGKRWPDRDPGALAQAVRAFVPLVQVPPRGVWGRSGPAAHTSAEAWLRSDSYPATTLEEVVLRYLAAFGPATVRDMQTWSGLTRLREVFDRLGNRLMTFQDEQGRQLYDLPEAPRPDPDTPAPPRFLYDYDNVLLSHADRGRVINHPDHPRWFDHDGSVPNFVLVDGFTSGTWKVDRSRGRTTLTIRPFATLPSSVADDLTEEGARLLAFVGDGAEHEIRLMAPDS